MFLSNYIIYSYVIKYIERTIIEVIEKIRLLNKIPSIFKRNNFLLNLILKNLIKNALHL